MARFFFHMTTKDMRLHDNIGKCLPSLSNAHEHALQLIAKTLRYVDTPQRERWMIEICSPPDSTQLVVLFPDQSNLAGNWFSFTRRSQQADPFSTDCIIESFAQAREAKAEQPDRAVSHAADMSDDAELLGPPERIVVDP